MEAAGDRARVLGERGRVARRVDVCMCVSNLERPRVMNTRVPALEMLPSALAASTGGWGTLRPSWACPMRGLEVCMGPGF